MLGTYFQIQPFSIHDGKGIRDTVFLKGCNLRCFWCHNPESISRAIQLQFHADRCIGCGACATVCPQAKDGKTARFTDTCTQCGQCVEQCFTEALSLVGAQISPEDLLEKLLINKPIYDQSGGGVTFSGGEPLLQPEFLLQSLKLCKQAGIHTTVETACNLPFAVLEPLLPYIDFIFCDLKLVDDAKHRTATGVSNAQILDNIRTLNQLQIPLLLRTPIIPQVNDDLQSMAQIADFIQSLDSPQPIELLAFHNLCTAKYLAVGKQYPAAHLTPPTKQTMRALQDALQARGVEVVNPIEHPIERNDSHETN